jgi:polysaccharide biosynthesis protein PslH
VKVLFLCPWVPWPLVNGGKIRTYHLLREAARRSEIHLHLVREPDPSGESTPADAVAELARFCASVTLHDREEASASMRWARSKFERWFHSPSLCSAVRRELAGGTFDLVHLDELALARVVPEEAETVVVQHHHKLDSVLLEALGEGGWLERNFDLWKLRRLEAYSAHRFPHQLLCSEGDARILRARHGDLAFGAVPSGFDSEMFRRGDGSLPREPNRLLFLGSMDYGPNVDGVGWFVDHVLDEVRREHPDVHLEIVGADPPPQIEALASETITVTGRVPEVRSHLERATALVVPLRIGGGTRLKIVEALAVGTPVVSTPIGAEGLDLVSGEHLLLAENPEQFARATGRLLDDPVAAGALGTCGRTFVHERYHWGALGDRLVDYWERAAGRSRGARDDGRRLRAPSASRDEPGNTKR